MPRERGRQPNYLGPGRIFTVCMMLYAVGVLTFGIYMLQTLGDLTILAFALVSAPIAGLVAWEHERQYRRAPARRRQRGED